MSFSIATNTSSSFASNALRSTQASLATSAERISSGKRVNSAKDDAAGLAISERMTSQIRCLEVVGRNVNDGISALQVADGGANQCVDQLQRIRELAVQASNGTLTTSDRLALQAEVTQVINEAIYVQNNTLFNGENLLDGNYSNKIIQVGANDGQTVELSIPSMELPIDQKYVYLGSTQHVQALNAGDLSINGFSIPASVASGLPFVTSDSCGAIKAAIDSMAIPGITVEAMGSYQAKGYFVGSDPGFSILNGGIVINGESIPASTGATLLDSYNNLAASINTKTSITGITASVWSLSGGPYFYIDSPNHGILNMQDGVAGSLASAGLNVANNETGFIYIRSATTYPPYPEISIAGNHPEKIWLTAGTYSANQIIYAARPDVTTQSNAEGVIADMDARIKHVTSIRASIGGQLSRMDSIILNVKSMSTNLSSSRAAIVDADYAQETANLSRAQILQQAATAMVAQANMSKQTVMALLKNI